MPNKNRERFYLERLRTCSVGLPEGEPRDSESPDFLIGTGPTLGVEFTEFHLPPPPDERPYQEVQSLQERVIAIAETTHASADGPALYVHAHFSRHGQLTKRTARRIGEGLAEAILSYPVPRSMDGVGVEIPRELLPQEIDYVRAHGSVDGIDRLWQGGNASWVAPVTAAHIQAEINRKAPKVFIARQKCEQVWLVVVQDLGTEAHACELTEAARHASYLHPFDRLLWLQPHDPLAIDLA